MSRQAQAPLHRTAYTVPEIAKSTGVPEDRVRQWIHDKRLRAIRDGQRFIVPVSALDEFLASAS